MRHMAALSAVLGTALACGLAVAQMGDLPTIDVSFQFGQMPTETIETLLDGALERVLSTASAEAHTPAGLLAVYRGRREVLQAKIDATPGVRFMASPTIRTRTGKPAEMAAGQQLPVKLLLPGLIEDKPLDPVEAINLDVPMRVAVTPYLAADDPTGLSAMLVETELGEVMGHLGEGQAAAPMIAKMAFTTVLDFADPDIDTYAMSIGGDDAGAMLMVFTVSTNQP